MCVMKKIYATIQCDKNLFYKYLTTILDLIYFIFISVFQSGKTVLANFLSDTTDNVGGEYRPTLGVRYLMTCSTLSN